MFRLEREGQFHTVIYYKGEALGYLDMHSTSDRIVDPQFQESYGTWKGRVVFKISCLRKGGAAIVISSIYRELGLLIEISHLLGRPVLLEVEHEHTVEFAISIPTEHFLNKLPRREVVRCLFMDNPLLREVARRSL